MAPDPAVGTRYVGLRLQYDGATIADVYDARTALEPTCATLRYQRGDPVDALVEAATANLCGDQLGCGLSGLPCQRDY